MPPGHEDTEGRHSTANGSPPTSPLQAGDADQDLDFDQFDLVQVQQAAKYLTGEPATWGEGDWNGAPGGFPQIPPLGDGLFNQLDIVAAQQAAMYMTGAYAALFATDSVKANVCCVLDVETT